MDRDMGRAKIVKSWLGEVMSRTMDRATCRFMDWAVRRDMVGSWVEAWVRRWVGSLGLCHVKVLGMGRVMDLEKPFLSTHQTELHIFVNSNRTTKSKNLIHDMSNKNKIDHVLLF